MMQQSLYHSCRALALATVAVSLAAGTAAAQADSTPARPQGAPVLTVDSVAFERARQMVLGGNAVAGRALADSLVQAVPAGTPAFGDALYWRATIAATAADAERDYRRIIIEYALAPHAGDALLALAQLEMSRGDRLSATAHLDRFLLEFPERSDRPRAGLWLGRLLLDQNNVPKACATLREAEASVPADQVELKNQIDYYMPRCAGVETSTAQAAATPTAAPATQPPASPSSAPAADSVRGVSGRAATTDTAHGASHPALTSDTAHAGAPHAAAPVSVPDDKQANAKAAPAPARPVAPPAANRTAKREIAAASARWTVQIAAYQTPIEAESLAAKMKTRAYDAYVVRATRIYRVRIGHFATRDEALALLASLRQRGTSGFVTTVE